MIDFHTHIFPEKIASKTLDFLESRCHTHPYTNGMASGLLASTREAGLEFSVVLPVVTKPSQFDSINRFAQKMQDPGEGLLSFGGIHPDNEDYKEKLRFIRLHLDEHISIREIERKYGVGHSLVSAWVKRYLEDGEEALEPKNGNPYAALHTSKSLSEVDRLRLIIAKQEVEIARLKKGYWVEGVGANKEYVTGEGKTTKLSKK